MATSKALAVLLLTAMASLSVTTQGADMVAARPAGCHQHGTKPPVSMPVSYRCCQSGHDSAMPQASVTFRLSTAPVFIDRSALQLVSIPRPDRTSTLMNSSADPPARIHCAFRPFTIPQPVQRRLGARCSWFPKMPGDICEKTICVCPRKFVVLHGTSSACLGPKRRHGYARAIALPPDNAGHGQYDR